MQLSLLVVLCLFQFAVGKFSISYLSSSAEEVSIHNAGTIFVDSPDRSHVADICARLGGFEPILKSGKCCFAAFYFGLQLYSNFSTLNWFPLVLTFYPTYFISFAK